MKKELTQKFAGLGLIKILAIPISIIASAILARGLGPDGFGVISFIISIITILITVVAGGLAPLLVREVSAMWLKPNDWHYLRGIIASALIWVLAVSLILIIMTILLDDFVVTSDNKFLLLSMAIFIVPLAALTRVLASVMKAQKKPVMAELPTLLIQPLALLVSYYVLWEAQIITLENVILANISAYALSLVLLYLIYLARSDSFFSAINFRYQIKRWLSALLPYSMLSILTIINSQLGILMLGFLGTNEAVGGLAIADRAGQFVALSLTIVNLIMGPYIVQAHEKDDSDELKSVAKHCARISLVVALPVGLVLLIFGEFIISLIYGAPFIALAYLPMTIIVVAQLFNVFTGSVGNILNLSGNEQFTLKGTIISVLTNLVLCIALIPTYGAIGAAIAVAISLIFWNLYLYYQAKKILGISTTAF